MHVFTIATLADLPPLAQKLVAHFGEQRLWLFEGTLGSGKTALIQAVGRTLGVKTAINSPTFTLLQHYPSANGLTIHHADLYRLKSSSELHELGLFEHMYGPDFCFVEWADRFPKYWPSPHVWLHLEHLDAQRRRLRVRKSG